ncbi:hypothetical protein FB45DRAFT_861173 [Roridomyces roridus]|uniref:Uncharacterized protein n=1 Tax=Roridomyces roridus TaxID=1738132 RepID=A0AAD7CAD6_9AGAR|nr:hypothetical protein FB45DRAFT_861173 [Roridomyces roridus]
MDYIGGVAPIVTTFGPGNLHHLAYGPLASTTGLPDIAGFVPTSNEGTSHFLLGFSYAYAGVGNSWTNATGVPANGQIVLGLNVASTAAAARDHGSPPNTLVAYRIPDNLDLD